MSPADSWMQCNAKSYVMTEALARVLTVEKESNSDFEFSFDLMALQVERDERNDITHRGDYARCLSAIRCYNTIRSMLIFMDSSYSDLPVFEYEIHFDLNDFLAAPCGFDFDNFTTVLISESVHDIPKNHREAVANLPWDMVIDLDGCSKNGGLRSAVTHNRIRDQVLDRNASRQAQHLVRGSTLWYRCGDYQDYSIKPGQITVNAYTPFRPNGPTPTRDVLEDLLRRLEETDRPLNIVILDEREEFVEDLISLLKYYDPTYYFITWIGLNDHTEDSICKNMFRRDRSTMEQVFRFFHAPVQHFFEAVAQHPDLWTPRIPLETQFTLHGENGPVNVSENIRNNLEPYFDVLYDGCENVPADVAEKEQMEFLHGHTAAWSTIANNTAVPLKNSTEMRQITDHIRSVLGVTWQEPGKRFVLIRHTSGFGGTTLARQIAWEMHKLKYPVLSVKSFDSVRVPPMLENLYDNILDTKPFVLLVEDTMRDRERLFDYVKRINRRCVVLCACRENSFIRIQGAKEYYLTVLDRDQIDQLRSRYRLARQQQGMGTIDWDLEQRITVALSDTKMCTPFIIGLHYFEKDFSISDYVKKALQTASPMQQEVLACLALCDKYGHKYVPVSLIKHALGIRTKVFAFPKQFPAAESLVCRGISGNDDVFYFKHWLLSECYLKEYGKGEDTSMTARMAGKLIEYASSVSKLTNSHLELLIHILIQYRDYNDDFSQLMMDIQIQSTQRTIMHQLIDSFVGFADEAKSQLQRASNSSEYFAESNGLVSVLKLISHAYAHLGRMYSRHSIHNYPQAEQFFRKAQEYMVDDNSHIYHMCGTGILDKLRGSWDEVVSGQHPTEEERINYRLDMEDAVRYFDLACHHGSPDYGYPSKLELYYRYLKYIYAAYNIRNEEELRRLPPDDRLIQGEFLRTLEEAQNMAHYDNFSPEAREKIERYDNHFQSRILFGEYGIAISFYENQVKKYEMQNDLERLRSALRNLFFTRINKLRQECGDAFPYGIKMTEAIKLFTDVDRLLGETVGMPESYGEYRSISTLYRYWFLLGKLTERSVDQGLTMANRWVDMECYFNTHSRNQSAEPFYHMVTMLYLSVLDNPMAHGDLGKARDIQAFLSRMDSTRRGYRYKIRDIFVNGNGMGRLRDVSRFSRQEEVLNFLRECVHEHRLSRPIPVDARIVDVGSHATLSIYAPDAWNTLTGSMVIGKESGNSISSNQINNRVRFLMGFGFDGIEALSATARDLSNENFSLDNILAKDQRDKRSAKKRVDNYQRRPKRIAVTPGRNAYDIFYDDEHCIAGLYGKYGDTQVKFTVSDLKKFGDDVLEPYGNLENIIGLMQKQETIPCVLLEDTSDFGEYVLVSMFDTKDPLYVLLGLPQPPQVTQKEQNSSAVETETMLQGGTIPKRTKVRVRITDADAGFPTGVFRYLDVDHNCRIGGKVSNNQRRSLKQSQVKKSEMNAQIMGGPDKNGVYTVKVIY